jgi:hypothetical protein
VTQIEPQIIYDPYPRRIGLQWRVIATLPNGQKEHISGFESKAEAAEWLASDSSQAWRIARLMARGSIGRFGDRKAQRSSEPSETPLPAR